MLPEGDEYRSFDSTTTGLNILGYINSEMEY